jgi:transketolase
MKQQDIDLLSINTIRTLSMDAVQKATCGHPGTPMALAPLGYAIWQNYLRFDPEDSLWPNRDRFVLSVGHASMLLYSLLHLAGVKNNNKALAVSLDDIKNFRQLGSPTPGHPEYGHTAGIETTTGPLGQGFANSVGMAIAEKWKAAKYNRPGFELFNYRIYAMGGDGCMMEGVSSEAASLAGHLKLGNLCWFYDNNKITIDGRTDVTFSEDVGLRFKAYGWAVLHVADANNLNEISASIESFQKNTDKPTLVIVDSHIGYGSPKQDKSAAHGEALGDENIKLTKKFYGWAEDEKFLVPAGVRENFNEHVGKRGKALNSEWKDLFSRYKKEFPGEANEVEEMLNHSLPKGWDSAIPSFETDSKGTPTRDTSGKVLNSIAQKVPWLLGGSADLAGSAKTSLKFEAAQDFSSENYAGRNLHFGIREHAMGSITNGMALSHLRTYGSTFLVFNDYQKPAVRLASLMNIPNIFIYTHDSIGLGEDGPTHQPIEQLAGLRAIPGLIVLRPADANEVSESWKVIMNLKDRPSALVLSRQNVPTIDRKKYHSASGVKHGAYVLAGEDTPDVIIISTGAEVALCLEAYELLTKENIRARVVSMPSWELFEKQSEEYKNKIFPPNIRARVAVEAASTLGWERYTGLTGTVIGMTSFGASAPLNDLWEHFGFTPEKIASASKAQIKKC